MPPGAGTGAGAGAAAAGGGTGVIRGSGTSSAGIAILGRASQKQVVNVAQRGGMCVIFVGRHAARLHGPAGK